MGQFSPHLHLPSFVAIELGLGWFGSWGSVFIVGGLGFIVMLVEALVEGGTGQSFLISKRLLDIFPALGHGIPT